MDTQTDDHDYADFSFRGMRKDLTELERLFERNGAEDVPLSELSDALERMTTADNLKARELVQQLTSCYREIEDQLTYDATLRLAKR